MRPVFVSPARPPEERDEELWQWISSQVRRRWPRASVQYSAYSGLNHRHWRVVLPTGEYFVLGVAEEALEAGVEEIKRRFEAGDWLARLPRVTAAGLLLLADGKLVEWDPKAGAAGL